MQRNKQYRMKVLLNSFQLSGHTTELDPRTGKLEYYRNVSKIVLSPLQYNGVNLRCATYEQAAMILKQSGNSVTILAQFNPGKFKETSESVSSQSEASTTCSTPINKTKHSHEGGSSTPPIRRNNGILPIIDNEPPGDLRYVFFTKSPSSLGFNIAGGNAMGIFVSEMQPDDEAVSSSGLSVGDHILEVRELARLFLG